jgi:hypothetical protein
MHRVQANLPNNITNEEKGKQWKDEMANSL